MYNVVFENVKEGSPYKGAITWTTYSSKEELDSVRESLLENGNAVIAEGVTPEEAVAYAHDTPVEVYLRVALHQLEEAAREEMERMRCDHHGTLDCSCPEV